MLENRDVVPGLVFDSFMFALALAFAFPLLCFLPESISSAVTPGRQLCRL
jgi:hypothetical protein